MPVITGDTLEVLGSVARGVYSYVLVTDPTLWSDTNWCGFETYANAR